METININEKKYVLESDMFLEIEKIKAETKAKYPSIKLYEGCVLPDEANILAVGSVELISGEWFKCRISTYYLEKVIKCLKEMSVDNKKGLEDIDLVWTKDYPCFIGRVKKNVVSGFIIAPKISND